jgi:hypothetical protein
MSGEAHGWSGEGGWSWPWAKVWITCTRLQLKRRLREREEYSIRNRIFSHACFKSPKLSLILACHTGPGLSLPALLHCSRWTRTAPPRHRAASNQWPDGGQANGSYACWDRQTCGCSGASVRWPDSPVSSLPSLKPWLLSSQWPFLRHLLIFNVLKICLIRTWPYSLLK